MTTRRTIIVAAAMGLAITACASRSDSIPIAAGGPGDSGASTTAPTTSASTSTSREGGAGAVGIAIDVTTTGEEISPLILGVSYDLSGPEMQDIGVRLSSWGGNLATRFNYVAGNLWNAALDWEYRNTDYGQDGDVLRSFLVKNEEVGAENRVAVPTIGWIAKDSTSCSFPDGAGGCTIADRANCKNPGPIGDPGDTSVPSTPEMVAGLVRDLLAEGRDIRFVAMDNEPELWGDTHYDVHPACPTFEEIAATYLDYAMAVRAVAPDAELMGPVMCCWYDYWRSDPGPADGSDTDFLTWFLKRVREHDDAAGVRTLDVVDVHFYPQSGVFNEDTDPETNARRLRSVRGLWDHEYTDESWIDEPIAFIPRLQQIVDAAYPGTPLAISEWNFGAETSMNGALAIADALGVYGREGVYAAAYWRAPPVGSPGYLAFKMHGNYDDRGARFGGAVVEATSEDDGTIGAYAALDEGALKVMLLNKDPDDSHAVTLGLTGFEARSGADRWTYGSADPDRIVADTVDAVAPIHLSPSSITVLELRPAP